MSEDSKDLKVCLITGGSSGIGLATAFRFAADGMRLAICGRDPQRLKDAQNRIESAGAASCRTDVVDLVDPSEATRFADETIKEFGRVDILVNNAAHAPLCPFENMATDEFEKTINVNIRSVFFLTQSVWRQMQIQSNGIVVNISSMSAVDPFPGFGLYGATKSWLDLMTTALAAEGKQHGIRVYSVRPGAVETPLLRGLFPDFPANATVAPTDVANAVWSLCQPELAFSSGEAIAVKK